MKQRKKVKKIDNKIFLTKIILIIILIAISIAPSYSITVEELQSRIIEHTKDFQDIRMTMNVLQTNKDALGKVDKDYSQLYEFKTADVSIKMPDKVKVDGRLGMVKFEYIISNGEKIIRSPTLKINRRDNFSEEPAKLQDAFDFGIVTPYFWKHRILEIIDDEEAQKNGEIKVLFRWAIGTMRNYAFIDKENLWVKRFEKRDGEDNLKVSIVYDEPIFVDEVIWVPTKIKMYAYDGSLAGVSEMKVLEVNSGIEEDFFK